MSRVGKAPIAIPAGVEASVQGSLLSVKGKLGQLQYTLPQGIKASVANGELVFETATTNKQVGKFWGLARAIANNMVKGVSQGFSRQLEIQGVGFRAAVSGNSLDMSMGYSHPVKLAIPQGLKVTVDNNTEITVSGYDRHAVGQFAANVRRVRQPEPYKGKGIRYKGEYVLMKEGKKK
jgi:large subunit ribosomal protein L6